MPPLLQKMKNNGESFPQGIALYFHELIEGAHVVIPSLVKPEPSSQSLELRKQLQSRYDHMQYNKMTRNVSVTKETEDIMEKQELADAKSQMGLVVNFLFSMVTVFVFGWYVGSKWWKSDILGIIMGLIGAIVILVIEVTLVIIRMSHVDAGLSGPKFTPFQNNNDPHQTNIKDTNNESSQQIGNLDNVSASPPPIITNADSVTPAKTRRRNKKKI